MMVIMKVLLLLYNIKSSTIHEAQNAKELCVFENTAFIPFIFVQYAYFSITNIDHGGRWPCPRRVGAQYGRPVSQKIANGLL